MTSKEEALVEQLHEQYAPALWRYCLRLTGGDRGRAEDAVQETLLRAWRHLDVLDTPPAAVRAWLFRVAHNLVVDDWRSSRARREVSVGEVPEPAAAQDDSDRLLQSWVVAEALTSLSPEHRAVLSECYFRGRSVADAAQRLGVPPGTVKSRTHYALRALRLALEEMGGIE